MKISNINPVGGRLTSLSEKKQNYHLSCRRKCQICRAVKFGQRKIVRTEIVVFSDIFNKQFNVSIKKTQVDTTYVSQASFWPVCSFAYYLVYTVGRGRVAPTVIITGLSNGRNVYPI